MSKTANIKLPQEGLPACSDDDTRIDHILTLPNTHQVQVHRSCACNELVSLHNRHLIDRVQALYSVATVKQGFTLARQRLGQEMCDIEPCSYSEVIKHYHGAKRKSYAQAYHDLINYGWNENMWRVKMFVKPDKYDAELVHEKAPRAIQYRSPMYNLMLAKYLKPMEHKLYSTTYNDQRWCAKGLNNNERAELIVSAGEHFKAPLFIMLDHSKFDSSVTEDELREAHKAYVQWLPSKELKFLLSKQYHNKGITKHGIRYSIKGTRMSGDYNTALDNSFINYVAITHWLHRSKVEGKIIIDGDDSVVVVEGDDKVKLMAHLEIFKEYGFSTVMETTDDLNSVEFCRSKILDTSKPRMAREPIRALSNLCVGLKRYAGKARWRYLAGNALGEMYRSSGVPLLYRTAKFIYEIFGEKGVIMDTETRYKYDLDSNVELEEPTIEDREQYQIAYGITPEDQILIENQIQESIIESMECPIWVLPASKRDVSI